MFNLGGLEWVVILLIVILLFGPGRIVKLAGELGNSIKAFREGLGGKKDDETKTDDRGNIEPK